jgi:hypothetical protein
MPTNLKIRILILNVLGIQLAILPQFTGKPSPCQIARQSTTTGPNKKIDLKQGAIRWVRWDKSRESGIPHCSEFKKKSTPIDL